MNKIEFRKVRDFGGILNVSFDYVRSNFKTLFKSNLLIAGTPIIFAGIFMGIYQSSAFNFTNIYGLEEFGIPLLLAMIFSGIAYVIVLSVTYSHIMIYKKTGIESFDTDEVWEETKKNFFMILFTGLGYIFILGLIAILTMGIGLYLTSTGYYFFIFLFLFGVGLVIYLSVNYSFIFIARLEEGISFSEALTRSKELIKGNWWFTFGLIIVVGMIQGFVSFVFYIPIYIVMMFVAFTGIENGITDFQKILFIIAGIISLISLILYMINIVAITFHYYNMVERKEAPGLFEQLDEIK